MRLLLDVAWVIAVSSTVACGRFNFDTGRGTGDDDGATGDDSDGVMGDAAPCLVWTTFGAPTKMTDVSSVGPDDWGPFVSADNLTMYMFSNRTGSMSGSLDLWAATRSDPGSTFPAPQLVPNVNSTLNERSPWISNDGLTLGFGSNRTGGMGQHDLYWSTRTDVAMPFGSPAAIPNVNSGADEFFSVLSANGLRLYITTTLLGTLDVFVAERSTPTAAFGTPVEIPELNTPQTERHVAISADELEVFIDSDRTGSQGVDIYRATRSSVTSQFTTPQLVPELSSAMDEIAPALSSDGSAIYYAYNTILAGGFDSEIWIAKRTCVN